MCGEQGQSFRRGDYVIGSPPRVRGTDAPRAFLCGLDGITPACAGNRRFPELRPNHRTDHPRVCGEQYDESGTLRTRRRITPACAGNSDRRNAIEHFKTGSPPRVRGTGRSGLIRRVDTRITPACAGNSVDIHHHLYRREDHPRVCGEQCCCYAYLSISSGSPPRVRGTVELDISLGQSTGITPACAGNSFIPSCWRGIIEDHPRVCGEQPLLRVPGTLLLGSPPRVRGTVSFSLCSLAALRITPACAGNRR